MTGPELSRHWMDSDEWTGFVLLLVPARGLPIPAQDLYRQVAERLRSHVLLHDLTTVGLAPTVGDSRDLEDSVAAAILTSAGASGHYVAPRVFFGCVVVGGAADEVDRLTRRLKEHALLRRLNAALFAQVVAQLEPAVTALSRLPEQMMQAYERQPQLAVDEPTYLAEVVELNATLERESQPERLTSEDPTAGPQPSAAYIDDSAPDRSRRGRWLRVRRQSSPEMPESYWLDYLASTAQAAALVFLVFAPDHNPLSRKLTERRKTVALALDGALGRVRVHPSTGCALNVAVEALVATSPLIRCRTLSPAGILTARDLIKVPTKELDIYETVELLIEAHQRAARALARRLVEVTSTHVIFFAATAPWPSSEAKQQLAALARQSRVTWIHFGDSDMISTEFGALDPDHIHLHADQPDIVNEVLHCADIYGQPDSTSEPPGLDNPHR